MHILLNKWRLDASLSALVHIETGEVQRLGEFHYILLETLVDHAGEVLSRNFLINTVWKNRVVGNNSLPTAIYALRAALGDDGRLQEIIKTVPKKGYVFNKDFITYFEQSALTEVQGEKDNEGSLPLPPSVSHLKRLRSGLKLNKVIGIAIVIMLLAYLLTQYYSFLSRDNQSMHPPPAPSGLIIKDETSKNYSRIRIYHLHVGPGPGHTAQLAYRMPAALRSINTLLQARQMNADFYYSDSVAKLSISLLIQDSCHHQYQLMLHVKNWLTGIQNLDSVIYQAAEKTINETPACQ